MSKKSNINDVCKQAIIFTRVAAERRTGISTDEQINKLKNIVAKIV